MIETAAKPTNDASEDRSVIDGIISDITGRRDAEAALRESRQMYRDLART